MPTDGDRLWLLTALAVLCCLLRGWFSACETALTELNDAAIHTRAETDARWVRLSRLIRKPGRLRRCFVMHRIFSAAAIGILCYCVLGSTAAAWFPFKGGAMLAGFLLTLLLTMLLSVLTDLFPKQIGLHVGEEFSRRCEFSVWLLCAVWMPFCWAASASF